MNWSDLNHLSSTLSMITNLRQCWVDIFVQATIHVERPINRLEDVFLQEGKEEQLNLLSSFVRQITFVTVLANKFSQDSGFEVV